MWSHFKTGEGKISVFFISFCIVASGTRRSRKKKETTENEMMENVLPQFLELTVKLMMLKLNCPFRDSAYRFGISVSTVSWIFDKSD